MAESQQPYPYTEIVNLKQKAQWIETSLSIERLLPYMRSAGYDGYTDLMVDGAPLPHQPDTIIRWLIDRPRS